MKFRNTLVVAVLFAALGAYLWWVERPKLEKEGKPKTVFDVKLEDVSRVTLAYPDKTIEIAKTGGGWWVKKPVELEADQTAVENLARAIVELELKRTLDGKIESLETYGLDKPAVTVSVALVDGKALPAIRVGKTSPVGWSTVVQLEGSEEVRLVPSAFWYGMKKEVSDLRNKTILSFEDGDVTRLSILGGEREVELANEGGKWKLVKPDAAGADDGEVRAYLSSLRALRAEDFVDEPAALGEYGLDSPRRRIAIDLGEKKGTREILVGAEKAHGKKDALFVKDAAAKTVFAVGTWAWASLAKEPAAFRDKTVLAFDKDALQRVEVARRDGQSFVLEKSAAAVEKSTATPAASEPRWTLAGAPASRSETIAQLVADLHSLKGFEVAAENPTKLGDFGLAEPDAIFTLHGADGKRIGGILIGRHGAPDEAGATPTYAMAEGGTVVLEIRDYVFSHLDKKKEDL
ncbi:MAG: DUF4340 domain-containing protein, partial [Candidatus Binatia bacterium]